MVTNINNDNNINNNKSTSYNKEAPQLNYTSCAKNMSINIINSEKTLSTLPKQKENILEDINLLISLKNKKRFQPKKIEFY